MSPDKWSLLDGDCAQVLCELPDGVVDAIVTDPPAGIGFMEYLDIAEARLRAAELESAL